MVSGMCVVLFLKETIKHKKPAKIHLLYAVISIAKFFKSGVIRYLLICVLFFAIGWSVFTQFLPVYLMQDYHFNTSQIAEAYAYFGLWVIMTQLSITQTMVKKNVGALGVIFFSYALLCLSFLLLYLNSHSYLVLLVFPLIAIFYAPGQPYLITIISDAVDVHRQGEVLGVMSSIISLAFFLGPLLAGYASHFSKHMLPMLSSFFIFCALIALVFHCLENRKSLPSNNV
jgi:DHA1 family tetracycline resistance protein-like MFS transporter